MGVKVKVIDKPSRDADPFQDLVVLLIDNDELLLSALKQQLSQWSNKVVAVKSMQEWQEYHQEKWWL